MRCELGFSHVVKTCEVINEVLRVQSLKFKKQEQQEVIQ